LFYFSSSSANLLSLAAKFFFNGGLGCSELLSADLLDFEGKPQMHWVDFGYFYIDD
jgi:hypothetical protein